MFMSVERGFRPIWPGVDRPKFSDGAVLYGNGIVGPSDRDKEFFNDDKAMSDEQQRLKNIDKKLKYAGILALASTLIYKSADGLSLAGSLTSEHTKEIIAKSPYLFLAGAVVGDYASAYFNGKRNLRLLKKVGFSPDLLATSIFWASEIIIGAKEKTRNKLTVFEPLYLSTNPLLIAAALIDHKLIIGAVTARTISTVLNCAQIVTKEGVLKILEKDEKPKPALQKGEQKLAPSGTIVDMKKGL